MIEKLTRNRLSSTLLIILVTTLLSTIITSASLQSESSTNSDPSSNDLIIKTRNITFEEVQQLRAKSGIQQIIDENNGLIDNHGTGLRSPSLEELSEITQNAQVIESIYSQTTSSATDNSATQYFPPIGNQDGEGSCSAWAVGYYVKTYQEAREHSWNLSGAVWEGGVYGNPTPAYQDKIISPDFIYHLINGGTDDGASFEEAINLVCEVGASSWAEMPYNPLDSTSWPSEEAWKEAALYRSDSASSYQYLYANTEEGLVNLKNWLSAGNLALIAVDADQYKNLSSNDIWTLDNYDTNDLNHANTIVGFNDTISYIENGVTTYGAFKIANSWGIGGWEKVNDGYYWISYETMKQLSNSINPCIIFYDLINYQPELSASFQIDHSKRGECNITIGLGSPSNTIITKALKSYITGGNIAFPLNNVVIDITEFKRYLTGFYNQSLFLRVFDGGTYTTGTINHFAIGDSITTETPITTSHYSSVYLQVNYSLGIPTITVNPQNGFAGSIVTINGTYFTPNNTVSLSYLHPSTSVWSLIADNIPTSELGSFSYLFNAPDLNQINPAGDYPTVYDGVIFSVTDNLSKILVNSSSQFNEARRGLTRINNVSSTGVFGNNTDLSNVLLLQNGQEIIFAGSNFSPGPIFVYFDNSILLGSATVDNEGKLNSQFNIPSQSTAGVHFLSIINSEATMLFSITCLPKILTDYDRNWHTSDYTINLFANGFGISDIYYCINNGEIKSVHADGQPQINSEGMGNTLEFWGIWSNNETTVELMHQTLSNIKLDKTEPEATISINNQAESTQNSSVQVTIDAVDTISGLQKVRISNDGSWDSEKWQEFRSNIDWVLTSGNAIKIIYCQIMDNAGLIVNTQASIILNQQIDQYTTTPQTTNQSSPSPSSGQIVTVEDNEEIIPEYSTLWVVLIFLALTISALVIRKNNHRKNSNLIF